MFFLKKMKSNDILSFVASDLFCKGLTILVMPIFAIKMGGDDFGKYAEWFSFYNIVFSLLSLGVPSFIIVRSSKKKFTLDSEYITLRVLLRWNLLILTIFLLLLYLAFDFSVINVLIFISASGFVIIEYGNSKCRIGNDIDSYFKIQAMFVLFCTIIPSVLVFINSSYELRATLFSLGIAFTALYVFSKFKIGQVFLDEEKNKEQSSDFNSLGLDILKYGLPLVLIAGVGWLKNGLDLQLLKKFSGYEDVGSLAVASQLVSIITIVAASLNRASSTRMYSFLEKKQTKLWFRFVIKLSLLILMLSGAGAVVIYLSYDYILSDYTNLFGFYMPMLIGSILYIIGQFLSSMVMYNEKTVLFTLAISFSSLIHPIVGYFIIDNFGVKYITYSYIFSGGGFLFFILFLSFRVGKY